MKPTSSTIKQPVVALFDSSSAMQRALVSYLHRQDFPLLRSQPESTGPLLRRLALLVNKLPRSIAEQIYIWSGWAEAIRRGQASRVNLNKVAQHVAGLYPQRRYPAIAFGASNGAATHLWAALGIPWLPQTFLMPVARSLDPDDIAGEIDTMSATARNLLDRNPNVQLHLMHDPNQDRLMVRRLSYFRFKWIGLPPAYRQFIENSLDPGGTIYVPDCRLRWPTTWLDERFYFQFGALGSASPQEYHEGSPRVREFLERYNADISQWQPPTPNGDAPEAEWGFEQAIMADLQKLADERGYRICRIQYDRPEFMSPVTAEIFREWNRRRGIPSSRLVVESFILIEPFWTVRTGSCPYWMVFSTEDSAGSLEQYLDDVEPYDEIYMMLFSHGVKSVGVPEIEDFRRIMSKARRRSEFIGVDESSFPRDFAAFERYHSDFKNKIKARHPIPPPLDINTFEELLGQAAEHRPVHVDWQTVHVG